MCAGYGVKLERLGTYLPNQRLDGTVDVQQRSDRGLQRNHDGQPFRGTILNRRNIGKTPDELVGEWDVANPHDPVVD